MKFEVYSTVDRGLEDLVIKDLWERHKIKAEFRNFLGKVFYETTDKEIVELNLSARSINRVIIKIGETKINDLQDIYRYIKNELDIEEYIDPNQTFAVRPNRIGTKKFTSIDIGKIGGQAIIDNFLESANHRLKVNLDNPDVEFYVEVIDHTLLVGIDTTGTSLHIRRYRFFNHPLPLKTTIGYLLVKATNWDQKEVLLDPTCGSGTILIEAAHLMRNIPICMFRSIQEFSMNKLKFMDRDYINEACSKLMERVDMTKTAPLIGVEINKSIYKGALDNIKHAKVSDTIKIINGDATKLEDYVKVGVPYIANNPPYKLPDRKMIIKFYRGYLKSIDKVLDEGGTAAIITTEKRLIDRFMKETSLQIVHERKIPYGSLTVFFIILEK